MRSLRDIHRSSGVEVECAQTDQRTRSRSTSPPLTLPLSPLSTSPTPTSAKSPHYKGLSPRRMCWMQLEVLQGRRRGLRLAPRLPWQLAHSSLPLSARPATANGQDTGCAPRARYRPPVLSTPEERRRVLLCIAAPFGETSLLILH